jgi:hypothetical protein
MSITFPLFNNQQNTVAVAETHSRIEGFINGFHPHSVGNGGTMFLNDVRGEKNVLNVAAINVWGKDAEFAKDAATTLRNERVSNPSFSIFLSVETQWQAPEVGTGEMKDGYEVKKSKMSFLGKNIVQVSPYKTGENPRAIIALANPWTKNLEMFEGKENTLAPAKWHSRIEGFLSGYVPHNEGDGGVIFLNDVRKKKDEKIKHVAKVNVWGKDAIMARDAAQYLRDFKDDPNRDSVFFSIDAQWQAPEVGTGEMNGEYEKKIAIMSMLGQDIIQLNPKRSGDYARGVIRTSESHAKWLEDQANLTS